MSAKIAELIICHTCHHRQNHVIKWEGRNYCDDCFNNYLDMIDPSIWNSTQVDPNIINKDIQID